MDATGLRRSAPAWSVWGTGAQTCCAGYSSCRILRSATSAISTSGVAPPYRDGTRVRRRLIDSQELGRLFFISSSRVNLGLHQRDVSVVWDLGPHDFSILLHWLEEVPESIAATGRDSIVRGIHDVAFMSLRFPSGIVANVELSWLAPSKLRRTAIVGSNQMVVYEDGTREPVRVFDRGVVYG